MLEATGQSNTFIGRFCGLIRVTKEPLCRPGVEHTRGDRILPIGKPKSVVITRIVNCDDLFGVFKTFGKFACNTAAYRQRVVRFQEETGISRCLCQSEALFRHLESSFIVGTRGVIYPESPEDAEQLRRFVYPLAQFSCARENLSDLE